MLFDEAKPSMFMEPIENRPASTMMPIKAERFSWKCRPRVRVRTMIVRMISSETTFQTLKKPSIVTDRIRKSASIPISP